MNQKKERKTNKHKLKNLYLTQEKTPLLCVTPYSALPTGGAALPPSEVCLSLKKFSQKISEYETKSLTL